MYSFVLLVRPVIVVLAATLVVAVMLPGVEVIMYSVMVAPPSEVGASNLTVAVAFPATATTF